MCVVSIVALPYIEGFGMGNIDSDCAFGFPGSRTVSARFIGSFNESFLNLSASCVIGICFSLPKSRPA